MIPTMSVIVAVVAALGFTILWLIRPGTAVEECCAERECFRPATHERFDTFIGPNEVVDLVCRRHARGTVSMRRVDI